MNSIISNVWGCFNPATQIGHYSANGQPNHFPEGEGRDTKLDFVIYYGDSEEAADVKDACEKARQKLRGMGATEVKPVTTGHP